VARISRPGRAGGCPFCANRKVLAGFNSIADTHPTLAAEFDEELNSGIEPTALMAGTAEGLGDSSR